MTEQLKEELLGKKEIKPTPDSRVWQKYSDGAGAGRHHTRDQTPSSR
jgi:hypothetical protein